MRCVWPDHFPAKEVPCGSYATRTSAITGHPGGARHAWWHQDATELTGGEEGGVKDAFPPRVQIVQHLKG